MNLNFVKSAFLALTLGFSSHLSAAVTLPHADLGTLPSESDAGVSQTGGLLSIDGSLANFIDAGGNVVPIAAPVDFRLLSGPQSVLVAGSVWSYGAGDLCIGSSCGTSLTSGTLLTASFSNLMMTHAGSQYLLSATLNYTGGSLVNGIIDGQFEALLTNLTGDTEGNFNADFSGVIGAVNPSAVPLPASAWLFAGALGLLGSRRLRKPALPV